ncbi:Prenylcysteine oxidase [Tupaia chinensis]|uniref:Prenylcysteine oxidase 1 n=1 Tax=Tupaia chinensis TaxID=246437 RepID=L9KWQ0_TUPCH|nr:Prenylcysteine oxidase [Tupaia chinensis]
MWVEDVLDKFIRICCYLSHDYAFVEEFHQYYQHIVTTFIKRELNTSAFSSKPTDEFGLTTVLSTDNLDLFINNIGIVDHVRGKDNPPPSTDGTNVWKIFSQETLTKAHILKLFLSCDYAVKKPWLAYLYYKPLEKCPSIILHDRLYYLNGIECAASAMQVSAMAAHNATLLPCLLPLEWAQT